MVHHIMAEDTLDFAAKYDLEQKGSDVDSVRAGVLEYRRRKFGY
jgi:hypothetical protein